mgnify:CR=1 FL=1
MKKTVLILSLLALLLGGWVAALWLLPSAVYKGDCQEIRYGVNEGLELVEQDNGAKGKRYVVKMQTVTSCLPSLCVAVC